MLNKFRKPYRNLIFTLKPINFLLIDLPKIHKNNTPFRPIISGTTCPSVEISKFIDTHLCPLVEQKYSLQDTTDYINFINKVNSSNSLPTGAILLSADVSALYTNIPHADGFIACKHALNRRSNPKPPTNDLILLLELVFKLNHFEFNGKFYLQIKGTAMGSQTAPSYANTSMGKLETEMIETAPTSPFCWKRFIDGFFFFFFIGSEQGLDIFKTHMNSFHNNIKFTFESYSEQVSFLDVSIRLDGLRLETSLKKKKIPANLRMRIHIFSPTSSHPHHVFKSIPYSQCLRIRRICSENEDAEKHIQDLQNHLSKRGQNHKLVDESIEKTKVMDRSSLLMYKEKKRNTYDSRLDKASKTVKERMSFLHMDEKLCKIFPDPPLISFLAEAAI